MVHDCVASLRDQVDGIVVVANNGYGAGDLPAGVTVAHDPGPSRNISRWWNLGLDAIEDLDWGRWNVLVVNDDVVMGPGSVAVLASTLRAVEAALAFSGSKKRTLSRDDSERITGWCFMLRGESGLRADERMEWWYGDNDLDWRARREGGSVTVPGVGHVHRDPNGYTNRVPDLAVQTVRDREVFRAKWGRLPH